MLTILLVVQIFIAVSMVGLILLQKSSADGLSGLSGGNASSGGGNSLLSGRASANILTKSTAILATAFMANSLLMATITARVNSDGTETLFEEDSKTPAEPSVPLGGDDEILINSTEKEPEVPIGENKVSAPKNVLKEAEDKVNAAKQKIEELNNTLEDNKKILNNESKTNN